MGAYAPDLAGLGVAAETLDEAKELIREAIDLHIEGTREHGDEVPVPGAFYVACLQYYTCVSFSDVAAVEGAILLQLGIRR